jgi:sugar (pentulose or hexulose) kinase
VPAHTQPSASRLYLGIDVGTTGTKAIVVDAAGASHGRGHATYELRSPLPGQYVQDATEWLAGVTRAVRAACDRVATDRIVATAISAQGGTLVAVDEHHVPLTVARSWLDRRATRSAATFERVFGGAELYRRTGWPIAPNNTAAQLLDLAHSEPEHFARAACFCDTAAYVNGWLTGSATVDANVAGISQLMSLATESWDDDILGAIGVPPDRLPGLARPGSAIGPLTDAAAEQLGLRPGTVIGAGAQDQYCAALGTGAIDDHDMLVSTGTAWVMLAVASDPYPDPSGAIGSGRHFALGRWGHFGEVSNGGVSIEWGRRLLGHGDHEPLDLSDLDRNLARSPRGSNGLSFFPFFDGTSPYDTDETSRGALLGLSLSHDHRDVLRAIAEGLAFSLRLLVERYRAVVGRSSGAIFVAGGATRSRECMQLLADVMGTDLRVSVEPDAACIGAAILAAIAASDVPDTRAGAARMAAPSDTVGADAEGRRTYDTLCAAYEHDARALSELYATR